MGQLLIYHVKGKTKEDTVRPLPWHRLSVGVGLIGLIGAF